MLKRTRGTTGRTTTTENPILSPLPQGSFSKQHLPFYILFETQKGDWGGLRVGWGVGGVCVCVCVCVVCVFVCVVGGCVCVCGVGGWVCGVGGCVGWVGGWVGGLGAGFGWVFCFWVLVGVVNTNIKL